MNLFTVGQSSIGGEDVFGGPSMGFFTIGQSEIGSTDVFGDSNIIPTATSGGFNVQFFSQSGVTLSFRLAWQRSSMNIAQNTSTLTWSYQLLASSPVVFVGGAGNVGISFDGTPVFNGSVGLALMGTSVTLRSGNVTIRHDSTGNKTFTYSFSQTMNCSFNGVNIGNQSGSGTGVLDPINRNSSVTIAQSEAQIGTTLNGTFSNPVPGAYYVIYIKNGNNSTNLAMGTATSWSTTLNTSTLQTWFGSNTWIWCEVTFATWFNGTGTGAADLFQTFGPGLTLTIPWSPPVISNINISDTNTSSWNQFGFFVTGQSRLNISFTTTPQFSATISLNQIFSQGLTFNGNNITTPPILQNNSWNVRVTSQDNRGQSATQQVPVFAQIWNPPSISRFIVSRADVNGNLTQTGTYASVNILSSVTPLNNLNTYNYVVSWRLNGTTTWTTQAITGSYNLNTIVLIGNGNFSAENRYDFMFQATDFFTTTTSLDSMDTTFVLMDFNSSGQGMSFGKASENANAVQVSNSMPWLYDPGALNSDMIQTIGTAGVTIQNASGILQNMNAAYFTGIQDVGWTDIALQNGFSGGTARYRVVANICYLILFNVSTPSMTAGSGVVLGTIPSGATPPFDMSGIAMANSGAYVGSLWLSASGNITITFSLAVPATSSLRTFLNYPAY